MATVTTSLVVEFKSEDGKSTLEAEVDSRDDGMNLGDTSFVAGDTVGYLIYKTTNVVLGTQQSSAGSLVSKGTELIDVEEFIIFANTREVSLPRPVYSGWQTPVWYGNNLGSITVDSETTAVISTAGVGVAKVRYQTLAYKWQLNSPSQLNNEVGFSIVIYIPGEVA